MKVQLVVAQGVHTGKIIPIATAQFLIGRDPQCNLRPASPSVSKQHCGIFIRGSKVVVKDYGSTNGTIVNGEPVTGERELSSNDYIKVGPLEFTIQFQASAPNSTVVAAPPAQKAAKAPTPASDTTIVNDSGSDSEDAAAMLLAMDDGNSPTGEAQVPDGTTVMDIPSMPGGPDGKPAPPPKPVDSSKAAADILSKYMRRPRT